MDDYGLYHDGGNMCDPTVLPPFLYGMTCIFKVNGTGLVLNHRSCIKSTFSGSLKCTCAIEGQIGFRLGIGLAGRCHMQGLITNKVFLHRRPPTMVPWVLIQPKSFKWEQKAICLHSMLSADRSVSYVTGRAA